MVSRFGVTGKAAPVVFVVVRTLVGFVALGVAVALVAVGVGASADPVAANRDAAIAKAGRLLAGVVLPAGTTRVSRNPASRSHQLTVAIVPAFFAAEVDRHMFWTSSASIEDVMRSFRSHLAAGAKLVVSESGGGMAAAAYAFGTRRRFLVGPEQLLIGAMTLHGGRVAIRVDAQVRYASPRPPSERVPSAARVVEITKAKPHGKPLLSLVVTQRSLVETLARVINGLPFFGTTGGVAYSCPGLRDTTDTFVFRARLGGPVLATVSEPAGTSLDPSPCETATLTIRGRTLPPLLEGGRLLEQASKLLKVKLTG